MNWNEFAWRNKVSRPTVGHFWTACLLVCSLCCSCLVCGDISWKPGKKMRWWNLLPWQYCLTKVSRPTGWSFLDSVSVGLFTWFVVIVWFVETLAANQKKMGWWDLLPWQYCLTTRMTFGLFGVQITIKIGNTSTWNWYTEHSAFLPPETRVTDSVHQSLENVKIFFGN